MLMMAAGALSAGAASKKPTVVKPTVPTLPKIGLGTWQTFDVGSSPAERQPLEEVLALFHKLGGRVVDSSPMYGNSEAVLGDIAAKLGIGGDLFVATKVWTSGREAGVRQMEDSHRKLRAPIDLMQVHNLVDAPTHLETLRAWKRDGKIRFLGVTHWTSSAYGQLARYLDQGGIDFVQVNYSVGEREAEQRILALARERGIRVLINRPFAGGSLIRDLQQKPLPAFAKELGATSWAQLLLKFVISHPAVTVAIPATSKTKHLRDNMAAASGPMPDAGLRQRIADAAVG